MKYRFFMVSRHGYTYVAAVTAYTLQEACRAHIKAWHARAASCAVVMRCPDGKRYSYSDSLVELLGAKKSAKKPEGWHACGNVGMEASE